jgi:hypothetical protein
MFPLRSALCLYALRLHQLLSKLRNIHRLAPTHRLAARMNGVLNGSAASVKPGLKTRRGGSGLAFWEFQTALTKANNELRALFVHF